MKGYKFVFVGVEFLAFNVLLHSDFVQQISLKNSLKTGFSIRNILLQFVSGVFEL